MNVVARVMEPWRSFCRGFLYFFSFSQVHEEMKMREALGWFRDVEFSGQMLFF